MTQCSATAYLVNADMARVSNLAPIRCELEAGHDVELRGLSRGGRYDLLREGEAGIAVSLWAIMPVEHPATDHAFTFRWSDPTAAELAEVLDPDEDFDLEVDIAPAAVIEHQVRVTADAEPVKASPRCATCGGAIESASLLNSIYGWAHIRGIIKDHAAYPARPVTIDTIPEANPRCSVCGREVERYDNAAGIGLRHVEPASGIRYGHRARVDAQPVDVDPLVDEHVD